MTEPIAAAREFPARELRRNWWVPLLALSTAAAAVVFEVVARPTAPVGYFLAWLSVVFAAVTATRNAFPLSRPVTLHVATGALAIGDTALVLASEIAEAKISPRWADDCMVRLVFRAHGETWLNMRALDAQTMVEMLGVGAGERRASFSLILPFRTRFLVLLVALGVPWTVLLAWTAHPAMVILSVFFSIVPSCAFLAWVGGIVRGRLVVGADGFSVRWLGRERFRPFSEVRAVRVETSLLSLGPGTCGTMIELASGRKLRMRTPDAPIVMEDRGAEARAMCLHLTQAFERANAREAESPNLTTLLGGGGRTGAEWLASLDELMRDGAGHYRVAAPNPELLTRVATDITSPRETRIGAAAALVRLDPEGRDLVRVVADACADPKLRGTLLSLVEAGTDEAVADALSRASEKA